MKNILQSGERDLISKMVRVKYNTANPFRRDRFPQLLLRVFQCFLLKANKLTTNR